MGSGEKNYASHHTLLPLVSALESLATEGTPVVGDLPYEELGSGGFERFALALVAAVLGPGVEVYGSGSDGRRDGTTKHPIDSPFLSTNGENWDGLTVLQVKHKERLDSPQKNLSWLKDQIRSELKKWDTPEPLSDFPRNILFISNVNLSASPAHGIDALRTYILSQTRQISNKQSRYGETYPPIRVDVWHRDKINALIAAHTSVRLAFPALLTAGDVLWSFQQLDQSRTSSGNNALVIETIYRHTTSAIRHERWIKLSEVAERDSTRISVEKIVVDIPLNTVDHAADGFDSILKWCITHSDILTNSSQKNKNSTTERSSQKPKTYRSSLSEVDSTWITPPEDHYHTFSSTDARYENRDKTKRHVLITGAAGNGKSTVSTFLTQLFRSRFLSNVSTTPEVYEIISSTKHALSRIGAPEPVHARWPFRINIPDLLTSKLTERINASSIIQWIAQSVSDSVLDRVASTDMHGWLEIASTLIVFDGLDEVYSSDTRRRIIDAIGEFIENFEMVGSDMFVIITSRPTGISEQVLPQFIRQIDLDYLDKVAALNYGQMVTSMRLKEDPVTRALVQARLTSAAESNNGDILLRTPLQVLIFTLLLEHLGELPTTRYELFWNYFDVMFKREAARTTDHARFLRNHRSEVEVLHEQIGLQLQRQCEGKVEGISARLPRDILRKLARKRFLKIGYDEPGEADELADRLVAASVERLVLLVADKSDSFSFELRSFQEFMAGRALSSGSDKSVRRRLSSVLPLAHWRNTWLFAAGKLVTDGDHRRDLLLATVETFDTRNGNISWLYPAAPELAADLIDDGLAANRPLMMRRLADVALRCLSGPMPHRIGLVATSLISVSESDISSRRVANALKLALAGTPGSRTIAQTIAERSGNRWDLPMPKNTDIGSPLSTNQSVARRLSEVMDTLPETYSEKPLGLVRDLVSQFSTFYVHTRYGRTFVRGENLRPVSPLVVDRVFLDHDATEILELCIGALDPEEWSIWNAVARSCWETLSRRPSELK